MRTIRSTRALLFSVAALAGCGGKTSDPTPGGTIDTTPLRPGWHSYDVTIRDGRVEWDASRFMGSTLPPTFESKWTARLDVHATPAGVADRAVFSIPYTTISELESVSDYRLGADGTLTTAPERSGIWFRSDSDVQLSIQLKSLRITSTAISATAEASYVTGDVGTVGKATFTFAAIDDAIPPAWSTPTFALFGDLPLPWEPQDLVLSEPTNGDPPEPVFTSNLHATLTPILTKTRWLGDTEASDLFHLLGVTVSTDQWDSAGSWSIQTPALADYAGHALPPATLSPKVAPVLTLESSKITGDLDPKLGHTWGPIAVDPKCGDGTAPCWHLGPTTIDYCSHSTLAGFALSLSGSAKRFAVEVRAVAKTPFSGPGELADFAFLQYATPGATPVTETISFGSGTSAAGTWDSGWQRIEKLLPGPAGASRAGIALSVGGKGYFGFTSSGCGGPIPPSFPVDVYVRLVEILP